MTSQETPDVSTKRRAKGQHKQGATMQVDVETLGALLDDAVLRHTGRSIGALASEAVAADVLAELDES